MNDPKPDPKPAWGYGVYEPPVSSTRPPGVILWYRVFALAMALYYGSTLATAVLRRSYPTSAFPVVLAISAAFAVVYIAAAFIRLTPRGWTIGLVMIGFGIVSCLFIPAIILLVFWLSPQTKAAFRRV